MRTCACLFAAALLALPAHAGRPFQTGDPGIVPYGRFELYIAGYVDSTRLATSTDAPATEVKWGAYHNLQLNAVVTAAGKFPASEPDRFGLGDAVASVRYRFLTETAHRPQIAFNPQFELPTGQASYGVGPGQLVVTLPIFLEKSFGPWTIYGGGGAVVNEAPGQRTYPFGGAVVERKVTKKLALGLESYAHGGEGPGSFSPRYALMLDAGGAYDLTRAWSLLFAAGHSIAGQSETYAYFGLKWRSNP